MHFARGFKRLFQPFNAAISTTTTIGERYCHPHRYISHCHSFLRFARSFILVCFLYFACSSLFCSNHMHFNDDYQPFTQHSLLYFFLSRTILTASIVYFSFFSRIFLHSFGCLCMRGSIDRSVVTQRMYC